MPNYTFTDTTTNEQFLEFMSMSEKDEYLKNNPHILQTLITPIGLVDSVRIGVKKPDNGFRDVLKKIKKANPLAKGINIH
mgnify:CR=1 FL=1|tara:strand:- start:881 stop:1120 length:240 start_codon:yes stop_codon:yes gene_type:complete